jgi:hypothetical protein
MYKLIATRIRVEKSEYKEEYFPEYCLEWKTWFGKNIKWCTPNHTSGYGFAQGLIAASSLAKGAEEWAQKVIDYAMHYNQQEFIDNNHNSTKQVDYYTYP